MMLPTKHRDVYWRNFISLDPGMQLGPYENSALLGERGMGRRSFEV